MKKTKNKLYCFGCSFTDANYKSRSNPEIDCGWPKWPEILGKKLGLESINRGLAGSSNDAIFHRVISSIINNHEEIDTICILWTNIWRYRIGEIHLNPRSASYRDYHKNWQHKIERSTMEMIDGNLKGVQETTFYGFLYDFQNLQTLCKKFNIRLISWCGCSFLNLGPNSKRYSELTKDILIKWHDAVNDNKFPHRGRNGFTSFIDNNKKFIDEKDIIGWPFVKWLGGNSYSEIIRFGPPVYPRTHSSRLEYCISELDNHPNANGHELIAETFWKHINDL